MIQIMKAIRSGHLPTLISSFLYFCLSSMAWMLIGALGVYISKDLHLTAGQKGIAVAVPLLGAAFCRILMGILADRFGPKRMGTISLSILILPLFWGWLGGVSFTQILLIGFLLGIAGASFAVALPLASMAYPLEHQGIAMGIVGAGNLGVMIGILVAPFLAEALDWHAVFGLTLIPLLIILLIFIRVTKEGAIFPFPKPIYAYQHLLKEKELWWFNLYYGVIFGGFVGLASFLGVFFHDQYQVSPTRAGVLSAICVFAGSLIRPIGGFFADRMGGMKLLAGLYLTVTLFFISIAFLPPLPVASLLFFLVMLALGMGNGAVFQWIPQRFSDEIGLVTGMVGAAGGLGGFFLPTLLGQMKGLTGSYAVGFLLFSLIAMLCFVSLVIRIKRMPDSSLYRKKVEETGGVRAEVLFGG